MKDRLERMIERHLREHALIAPGDRIVVGVSGGRDSVVLLHCLSAMATAWSFRLVIAHVNYRVRGRAADHDEAFVRALAKRLGWPCTVKRCHRNQSLAPNPRPQNFQAWARTLRYDFFATVARRHGAQVVAVAHHREDQCETVLFNMIRGSGPAGLCGMPWSRVLERHAIRGTQSAARGTGEVRLIRPFLGTPKADLVAYARRHRIACREDASNRQSKYTRNRIRRALIPMLRRLNPEAVAHCCRVADRMGELTAALESIVDRAWERCGVARQGDGIRIDRRAIADFPTAVRRRILQRAYGAVHGDHRGLAHDHLAHMDAIIDGRGLAYSLPGGVAFRRGADTIQFLRAPKGRVTLSPTL